MKVLLINPAWKIGNKSNLWRMIGSCYPSLGLAYIAAVLEQEGHEVLFLDMNAENYSLEEIGDLVKGKDYEGINFVGITSTTPLINCAHSLAGIFKRLFPATTVVLGGTHPSILPEEVLGNKDVDIVVRGEGEFSMKEIVNGIELSKIRGISYRGEGIIVHTPERPRIENLDNLPLPAYHLMPIRKYRPAVGSYKRLPAMSMFATRGCPGRCTFCYRVFDGRIRSRSAGKIVEEIKLLQREYGIKEINFYDDTFTALKKNVKAFCNIVIDEKLDITWSCFTRVNYVDEDIFRLMKKAGCHQVMLGIESGVQEVLDRMNKMTTINQIRDAVAICKKVGIEVRAAYMFGNIGETKEQMEQTLKFAIDLDTEYALFNILAAYPGTGVWGDAKKNGWLKLKDYNYSYSDCTLELPDVSQKEIMRMYTRAHQTYYLRPKVIWRRIKKLRSLDQFKQEIKGGLALLMNVE